jgi:hypothetical protein
MFIGEFFVTDESDDKLDLEYALDIDCDFNALFANIFVQASPEGEGGIPETKLVGMDDIQVSMADGVRTNDTLYEILVDSLKKSYSRFLITDGSRDAIGVADDTVYTTMYEIIRDVFGRFDTGLLNQPNEALVRAQLEKEEIEGDKTLGSAMITNSQWLELCESLSMIPRFVSSSGKLNCDLGTSLQVPLTLVVRGYPDEITVAITLTNTGMSEAETDIAAADCDSNVQYM